MAAFTCVPLPNGDIELTASGRVNAREASSLIVAIAKAATEARRQSGRQLIDRTKEEAPIPYIEATAFGLATEKPQEDYVLLSLQFGEAEVGIAIAKSDGRQLGQALIAACVDETTAH
jgi:hypothetical protein